MDQPDQKWSDTWKFQREYVEVKFPEDASETLLFVAATKYHLEFVKRGTNIYLLKEVYILMTERNGKKSLSYNRYSLVWDGGRKKLLLIYVFY